MSAPGHDDDVARELGARLGHADLGEPVVEAAEVGLGEVAQREVLPVRDADVEVEVALDVGEATELLGRDVAEPGVRVSTLIVPGRCRARRSPLPTARTGRS